MRHYAGVLLSKTFLSGALFMLIGIGVFVEAGSYPMGTPLRMGPGFFPTMIGGLTALIGLVLMVNAAIARTEDRVLLAPRPLFFIIAGIVVFALSLERFGLLAATVLLVVITRLASRPMNWVSSLTLGVCLAVVAAVIFWYVLRLPLRLWP